MLSSISRSSSHSSITNDVTLSNNNNTNHQSKKQQKNTAFVFIKPLIRPNKDTKDEDSSIYTLVRAKLLKNNIKINFECTISSNQIDKSNIIDKHYYNIASKALCVLPKDLTSRIDIHLFQVSFLYLLVCNLTFVLEIVRCAVV